MTSETSQLTPGPRLLNLLPMQGWDVLPGSSKDKVIVGAGGTLISASSCSFLKDGKENFNFATAVGEEGTWNSTYSPCSSLGVERGNSDLVITVGKEVDEVTTECELVRPKSQTWSPVESFLNFMGLGCGFLEWTLLYAGSIIVISSESCWKVCWIICFIEDFAGKTPMIWTSGSSLGFSSGTSGIASEGAWGCALGSAASGTGRRTGLWPYNIPYLGQRRPHQNLPCSVWDGVERLYRY